MTSVELKSVVKQYGDVAVIKNLDVSVVPDITTAIVGESGSGKSTLLQLINGLVLPDHGTVSLDGVCLDYEGLPRIRRNIGYAVQGAGLFPHLSIEDNIALVARLENWPPEKVRKRIELLFQLLDLDLAFLARFPNSLSGGQQQRVSLCRAMMLNPRLLLLDEPFSALDPITRSSIHEEFIRLQALESRTIVLVTHDMSEAIRLAQRVIILKSGEIVQQGSVEEVRRSPVDAYVEKLLSVSGSAL